MINKNMSEERRHECAVIFEIFGKMAIRVNCKLTAEEKEVMKKHNIRREDGRLLMCKGERWHSIDVEQPYRNAVKGVRDSVLKKNLGLKPHEKMQLVNKAHIALKENFDIIEAALRHADRLDYQFDVCCAGRWFRNHNWGDEFIYHPDCDRKGDNFYRFYYCCYIESREIETMKTALRNMKLNKEFYEKNLKNFGDDINAVMDEAKRKIKDIQYRLNSDREDYELSQQKVRELLQR